MIPRPATLKQIADRSDSLEAFGRNLRDWLHEMRNFSSRPEANRAIEERPRLVRSKFAQGEVADAWLAAYAESVASRLGLPHPRWAFDRSRVLQEPWVSGDLGNSVLRLAALRSSPLAFKRRNIFSGSIDLPLRLQAGRPRKSAAENASPMLSGSGGFANAATPSLRRNARPSRARASCETARGRQMAAAAAIARHSGVKDSITRSPR